MQVTHTDLKPENLLIGNENQIKICDFGTGQKGPAPDTQWTVIGELSSLWYRAPELLLGSKTVDYKIDLWAIGCIMMEMLSGAAVFQGQPGPQFASPCPDVTHRNFNSDQVHKVLSMAGTPASLAGFECASLIKGWPPFQRHVEPTVTASAGLPAVAPFSICCLFARAVASAAIYCHGLSNLDYEDIHMCKM
jgi:serine/threonine protein kinase